MPTGSRPLRLVRRRFRCFVLHSETLISGPQDGPGTQNLVADRVPLSLRLGQQIVENPEHVRHKGHLNLPTPLCCVETPRWSRLPRHGGPLCLKTPSPNAETDSPRRTRTGLQAPKAGLPIVATPFSLRLRDEKLHPCEETGLDNGGICAILPRAQDVGLTFRQASGIVRGGMPHSGSLGVAAPISCSKGLFIAFAEARTTENSFCGGLTPVTSIGYWEGHRGAEKARMGLIGVEMGLFRREKHPTRRHEPARSPLIRRPPSPGRLRSRAT